MKFVSHRAEALSQLREAVRRGLDECGQTAENRAKDLCPVESGRLRDSIGHAVEGNTVAIGANTDYAVVVELGGAGRPPKPYLRPAVEESAGEFSQILERALRA